MLHKTGEYFPNFLIRLDGRGEVLCRDGGERVLYYFWNFLISVIFRLVLNVSCKTSGYVHLHSHTFFFNKFLLYMCNCFFDLFSRRHLKQVSRRSSVLCLSWETQVFCKKTWNGSWRQIHLLSKDFLLTARVLSDSTVCVCTAITTFFVQVGHGRLVFGQSQMSPISLKSFSTW